MTNSLQSYKMQNQLRKKPVVLLCTKTNISEMESIETLLSTIASNKTTYPEIKLTKKVKDIYSENYKALKKLKKTLKGRKTSHAYGLAELILYKGPSY